MERATLDAVNPAWTTALGWPTSELENWPYADLVRPDDAGGSAAAFERVREGNSVLRFENRCRTKDGGWRWLSWVAVPDGENLYSVTRDVTAEKERQRNSNPRRRRCVRARRWKRWASSRAASRTTSTTC